ncbi:hypothetical protein [Rhodonellum sp.]|uniref:hypothetical protein n=1 Tax=Rhodonellum sp. TaxID=2231180 RepID=UPI0027204838|nr:hypothetical protein [Rhodonellum sp.]MDO9554470.1 hypothetical protein [Rhodonellum sp.]
MQSETPSFRQLESPSLVVLPDNTLFGVENKSIFKSELYSLGKISIEDFPPNSLYIMQNVDPAKELIYIPLDFPVEDLVGLSLMNRRNPIIPLGTDDILRIFDQFPNIKILHLDGFEINQAILDLLISKNMKMLALIRVDGIDLRSIVCSEIDTIIIEEKTFEANKNLEIESCRKIIRD